MVLRSSKLCMEFLGIQLLSCKSIDCFPTWQDKVPRACGGQPSALSTGFLGWVAVKELNLSYQFLGIQ